MTFTPVMDEPMDSQSACGKACSTVAWSSACTMVVWHYRSTLQGLQPIRPVVIATRDLELEPEKLLLIE